MTPTPQSLRRNAPYRQGGHCQEGAMGPQGMRELTRGPGRPPERDRTAGEGEGGRALGAGPAPPSQASRWERDVPGLLLSRHLCRHWLPGPFSCSSDEMPGGDRNPTRCGCCIDTGCSVQHPAPYQPPGHLYHVINNTRTTWAPRAAGCVCGLVHEVTPTLRAG